MSLSPGNVPTTLTLILFVMQLGGVYTTIQANMLTQLAPKTCFGVKNVQKKAPLAK